jgi:pimeloyl-ACP methyl ester carboxylesterase
MLPPAIELGGPRDGGIIALAIANGFPPQTYLPMLRPLMVRYRVVCLPPRALWGAGPPGDGDDWPGLARDLLDALQHHGLDDVIAIGHSFGGVAWMLAALEAPQRFRGLVLLDPTISPEPLLQMMREVQAQGMTDQVPIVQAGLRRRERFLNREEAFAYLHGRKIFADWPDETLRLYVTHGLKETPAGDVELTWPVAWEVHYYRTLYTHSWDHLPGLDGLLPTLFVAGETTDAFVPESAARVRQMLPAASHVTIPQHGHLFPQSAPGATSAIIGAWLRQEAL